ncbi:MAG: GntR family transcriptional regulator [Lentisphaeria bacterium]|nr:GntR family transcriptional regulator [Lentisphaeria bacterium]
MPTTKCSRIYEELLNRIRTGVYPVNSRFPSEYLLAEEFKVNKKTANKAVDLLVNDGLLQRKTGGAGTVVIQSASFPAGYIAFIAEPRPYQMRILTGLQQGALEYGYAVLVFFPSHPDCLQLMDSLASSRVSGFVLCSHFGNFAPRSTLPCVTVDHDAASRFPGCDTVSTDNFLGGKLIMDEVIRRGHRELAVYSSGRGLVDRTLRIDGFLESMRNAGVTVPSERIFYGVHYDDAAAVDALERIRQQLPGVSIIVCDADDAAVSMLKALRQLKLTIPVTSFGNTLNGADRPAAVEQFPELQGSAACRRLMHNIAGKTIGSGYRELTAPKLVNVEEIPIIG